MAGSNNFLVFDENVQNMMVDVDYSASNYRINGAISGIAPSVVHNKLYYQVSIMAAAIGESLADKGFVVSDSQLADLKAVLAHLQTQDEVRWINYFQS